MKTPRPDNERLVERILSGEITRPQAARIFHETTGGSPDTFRSWLSTSGAALRLKEFRANTGKRSIHAHTDPDKVKAYEGAIALAMSGKVPLVEVARRFPSVNYVYLCRIVKKRKAELAERAAVEEAKAVEERARKANDDTIRALAREIASSK